MSLTHLVTGASRGLGLELARQLAARGGRVIAGVRRPEEATGLRELSAEVVPLDVTDAGSVAALAERLRGRPLDVLVNNAGLGGGAEPLERLDVTTLDRYFQVNALGALRMVQAVLPNLRAGSRKLVVNVTSRMGSIDDNSSGGYYGYRASKAALNMINRSLAIDLADDGFTCVVLHPGWVATDMGGMGAKLSPRESVERLLRVMDRLTRHDSGKFFDYTGHQIPW
jgi:NAD(P)-dependent dehydrogenase (short-subunit alcohol dehydrogenase family)